MVSPGNDIASTYDGYYGGGSKISPNNRMARMEGRSEFGGRIQVLNLGAIESWVRGKPEFIHYVYSSTGVALHSHPFGKIKRSHFKNQQWNSLKCFIGSFGIQVFGEI